MRFTQLLSSTLREAPRDAESGNQELLIRAGYVRQLIAGVYSFLPLGTRVLHKIEQILRSEMDNAGGQEVIMPVLQPRELWEKRPANGGATRAEAFADVLFNLRDRRERDLVLGPTHEEIVTTLAQEFIRSYRDLPRRLYQIQTKMRNETRSRGGLLRTREFLMKDLYSFDADAECLDASFAAISEAYHRVFQRCGLRYVVAEADSGANGGKESREFIALTEAGEDLVLRCERCEYTANQERAEFVRTTLADEPEKLLEEVYTPDCMAISDLTAFLDIPASKTIKAVCYGAGDRLVLAIVRGDLEVNEVKLGNVIKRAGINAFDLHLATAEELMSAGIVAGYTSPMDKGEDVLIVADISLQQGQNFVAGANKAAYHVKNVNYPRDFRVDSWADIATADEGATCVRCGGTLHGVRGSELGHIFKLGAVYSELFEANYLDAAGATHPLLMACYGIGLGRVMGCIVEQHHDERGLVWPFSVAPYHVELVGLDLNKSETGAIAEQLYADMLAAGVEVLFDDRGESAGIKFNDADLLGLPLRLVVSKRSLKNGGVEVKLRSEQESRIIEVGEAVQCVKAEVSRGLALSPA